MRVWACLPHDSELFLLLFLGIFSNISSCCLPTKSLLLPVAPIHPAILFFPFSSVFNSLTVAKVSPNKRRTPFLPPNVLNSQNVRCIPDYFLAVYSGQQLKRDKVVGVTFSFVCLVGYLFILAPFESRGIL